MARINVIIREIESGKVYNQLNNQEGKHLPELEGEAYDKRVYDLIERTAHRVFGPNGMIVLTGFRAKGKNAGFLGLAGHKVRGRPHLFASSRPVCITFEVDGNPFLKELSGSEEPLPEVQQAPAAAGAAK